MIQYLTEQNITLIVGAVVAFCSLLSAILQLAGKTTASKIVGGLPAAIDLGGILRWLKRNREAKQSANVTAALLLALLASGCVGTFDEARLAQHQKPQPANALDAVIESKKVAERCSILSDREYWFGLSAEAFGASGAGAIVTAIPVKSERGETALMIAGASAAAVAAVSAWASREAGANYVQEGCAK